MDESNDPVPSKTSSTSSPDVVNVRVLGGGDPIEFRQSAAASHAGALAIVKDFAPIVTAVAGAVISYLVFHYGNAINTRQALASSAALRASAIAGLSDPNLQKKELAAIALADYRDDALPAVKMFLSSRIDTVRVGGVMTAARMYEAEVIPRKRLLADLRRDFDSPSPALRRGVIEVYEEILPLLTSNDVNDIMSMISGYVDAVLKKDVQAGDNAVLLSISNLLKFAPDAEAPKVLFRIADKAKHQDARTQAYQSLGGVTVDLDRNTWNDLMSGLRTNFNKTKLPEIEAALKQIETLKPKE